MGLFKSDTLKELLDIKFEIACMDKEIDKMVYELYGLTDEKIKIVLGV